MVENKFFIINTILIFIIFLNVFILSNTKEHFENKNINAEMRPCTIYLINEENICDKLDNLYKFGRIQLQYLLDVSQEKNEKLYTMLKYVQNTRNVLPINQCKIVLDQYKEVYKNYDKEVAFKNLTKEIEYNEDNLSGYCLYSSINKNTDVVNINDNRQYKKIKVPNDIDVNNLQQTFPNMCTYESFNIQNGLKFIKLSCSLSGKRLLVSKLELIEIQNNKFVQIENQEIVNSFFTPQFNNKKVEYKPIDINISFYIFGFDFCKKVESMKIAISKTFSLEEIGIKPQIILFNVDLEDNDKNYNDISSVISLKINKLTIENGNLTEQIQNYEENKQNISKMMKEEQRKCIGLIDTDQLNCMQNINKITEDLDLVNSELSFLKEESQQNKNTQKSLIQSLHAIRKTKMTIEQINSTLEGGYEIDYYKYIEYMSNDDCLYLLF